MNVSKEAVDLSRENKPFDVVRRLGDEESLKVQVDLNRRIRINGNSRVDAVISGELNGDQQQIELDETEPAHTEPAGLVVMTTSTSNVEFRPVSTTTTANINIKINVLA